MSAFLRPTKTADLRFLARISILCKTPMAVATGEQASDADSDYCRDANGLPSLPGSSIAGVLSHAWKATGRSSNSLFGEASNHEENQETQASALIVSDGIVHLSDDLPAPMLPGDPRLNSDRLLTILREGVRRDHVRIDARGAAEGDGKFDARLVPAGTRFTFELELLAETARKDEAEDAWRALLGLMSSPLLRFGCDTRRGLGAFEVLSVDQGEFDLNSPDGLDSYLKIPRSLTEQAGLTAVQHDCVNPFPFTPITLQGFRADSHWLFAGGDSSEDGVDIAPLTETIIEQSGNGLGVSEPKLVMAGSSLKGAIAHRVRFHLNRLMGCWLDRAVDLESSAKASAAYDWLFGHAAKHDEIQKTRNIGALIIDDLYLERGSDQDDTFWHVCIDRFTGGVRSGMLFREQVAAPRTMTDGVQLLLIEHDDSEPELRSLAKDALRFALADLAAGRLTLGAAAGRGHGGFRCDRVLWGEETTT